MLIPFFWISLGLGLGALLGFYPVDLPLKLFPAIFILMLGVLFFLRGTRIFLPIYLILLILLGGAHARIHELHKFEQKKAWGFLPEDSGEKNEKIFYILEGRVESSPEYRLRGRKKTLSFVLSAETLLTKASRRFQKRVVFGQVQVFLFQPPLVPEPGDRVRCYGFLERPRSPLNPEEFDYAGYLEDRGIFSIFRGYGRSVKVLEHPAWNMAALPWKARAWVQHQLETLFKGDTQAVLDALITGHQKNISDSLRDDFVKTGTAHLLAVSGLNITLVVGSFFGAMRLCGLSQTIAAAGSLLVVIFYTALAGFGVPVLRAAWMSTAVLVGLLLGRNSRTLNAFFLAFICMVLVDPGNLRGIGCQLSYLSVLGLMLFGGGSEGNKFWGLMVFRGTLAAMLMTLPVGIHYFHVLSLSGIVANLLAIPLFHLALMMGFISLVLNFIPLLGPCLCRWTQSCMDLGFFWIHSLSQLPGGYGYFGSPALWQWILYYGSLVFLVLSRMLYPVSKKNQQRALMHPWIYWIMWGLWGVSLLGMLWPSKASGVECVIFSAGQNEIFYLRSPSGRHYLVNSGRNFPSDQSRWILHPFLKARSVKKIETVFLTDFSRKHTGGLDGLSANFKIQKTAYPRGAFSKFVYVKKPYSWIAMPKGLDLELEKNFRIKWLGVFQNQGVLQMDSENLRILYLPILSSEIIRMLKAIQTKESIFTVLVLGSKAEWTADNENEILSQTPVELIAVTRNPAGGGLRTPVVELEKLGALMIQGNAKNASLAIQTVRGGAVSWKSGNEIKV